MVAAQVTATVLTAVAFGFVGNGSWSALSAACGGAISLCIVWLLRRGVRRASELALTDQKKSMLILYLGAVQRFVAVLALFALGLGVAKLEPLAMFAGFAAAQVGNFIGARK
jgi:ATP synthase protein I